MFEQTTSAVISCTHDKFLELSQSSLCPKKGTTRREVSRISAIRTKEMYLAEFFVLHLIRIFRNISATKDIISQHNSCASMKSCYIKVQESYDIRILIDSLVFYLPALFWKQSYSMSYK